MGFATASDGTRLYYEEAGSGELLVFVHEFAGDHRAWAPQMQFFARRYHCVAYAARGYPPSDVPEDVSRYSQDIARDDVLAVVDHFGVGKAHIVGLSMGGFATLHFGLEYPSRARSLVVAGCGYGAEADKREQFQAEARATAAFVRDTDGDTFATRYGSGPTRVQLENKDPQGYRRFITELSEHSLTGAANTLEGVQGARPSLYDLEPRLVALDVPMLVITGDEDEPCLAPNVFLKRSVRSSALEVLPNSGHTINIEEPARFNAAVADFLAQVDSGRWPRRDPRSLSSKLLAQDED